MLQDDLQHTPVRQKEPATYLVGLAYDAPDDDDGYFDFRRRTTLETLAEEIQTILDEGHHQPTFPPQARPRLLFVWNLDDPEDGDCYAAVMERLEEGGRHEI
ncbi:MAG: hypothetical protein ACE5D8_06190 [Fidelibacterota bacterium]